MAKALNRQTVQVMRVVDYNISRFAQNDFFREAEVLNQRTSNAAIVYQIEDIWLGVMQRLPEVRSAVKARDMIAKLGILPSIGLQLEICKEIKHERGGVVADWNDPRFKLERTALRERFTAHQSGEVIVQKDGFF